MKNSYVMITALVLTLAQMQARAQNPTPPDAPAKPTPSAQTTANKTAPTSVGFDLSEYGVHIAPDARLIVMMAALDAAGFDPTPPGRAPALFRAEVRRDQANLDPDLIARLRGFYERHKLKDPATQAEQAARYVSLAYALSPPPALEAPPRSDDLFEGVLDVFDFAPLVREFYLKSGIEARLPAYMREYQQDSERLRRPAAEMIRAALLYLHTRPVTTIRERVPVNNPDVKAKKKNQQTFVTREHERKFLLVPDLLAAPGAINFRVVGDDYFAIVPSGVDPASSEVRRAYLQYLIDPLVLRFNREIALRRADIRALIDARKESMGGAPTPDIFTTVARSLVVAADVRMNTLARLQTLALETSARLQSAQQSARAQVVNGAERQRAAVEDEATAQLADAYERGAALDFYFVEQLRDQEVAGFDVANFFADMINRIDVAREKRRPAEYKEARERALAARREAAAKAAAAGVITDEEGAARRATLVKNLDEVNELLRAKKYTEAETQLKSLMPEYQGEPHIFFALAQTASVAAADAFDENVRNERLGRALANYRFAINAASPDTDAALVSRAHTAMGRIYAFLDRRDEALKEFDAAVQLGNVPGGAFDDALKARRALTQP